LLLLMSLLRLQLQLSSLLLLLLLPRLLPLASADVPAAATEPS
jgi:hypothetical protein